MSELISGLCLAQSTSLYIWLLRLSLRHQSLEQSPEQEQLHLAAPLVFLAAVAVAAVAAWAWAWAWKALVLGLGTTLIIPLEELWHLAAVFLAAVPL